MVRPLQIRGLQGTACDNWFTFANKVLLGQEYLMFVYMFDV